MVNYRSEDTVFISRQAASAVETSHGCRELGQQSYLPLLHKSILILKMKEPGNKYTITIHDQIASEKVKNVKMITLKCKMSLFHYAWWNKVVVFTGTRMYSLQQAMTTGQQAIMTWHNWLSSWSTLPSIAMFLFTCHIKWLIHRGYTSAPLQWRGIWPPLPTRRPTGGTRTLHPHIYGEYCIVQADTPHLAVKDRIEMNSYISYIWSVDHWLNLS